MIINENVLREKIVIRIEQITKCENSYELEKIQNEIINILKANPIKMDYSDYKDWLHRFDCVIDEMRYQVYAFPTPFNPEEILRIIKWSKLQL